MEFQPGDLVEAGWFKDFNCIKITRGPAIVIKARSRNCIQVWIVALAEPRLINPYWIVRRLTPRQEDNNEVSTG